MFLCNSSLVIKIPRGNKTGPTGLGSRTGRGLGYCTGYSTPGYTKGPGMGLGRGYRGGRGWGRGGWFRGRQFYPEPYYQSPNLTPDPRVGASPWTMELKPEEEIKYLEDALSGMKKEIETIEKRIDELRKNNK